MSFFNYELMKVIVSHDVDHLYVKEHWKDLHYVKMWGRSFCELLRGRISWGVFFHRLLSIFDGQIHRIPDLCEFDLKYGIRATYFFGMNSVLGMAYKKENAVPWINYVVERGFEVGVHGCDYQNVEIMRCEHDDFAKLSGQKEFGIRNHYVRYDSQTFLKMSQVGYLFDTTEFNKDRPTYKAPYKYGAMWEFPLAIMDGYVLDKGLDEAKRVVENFVRNLNTSNNVYLTILFHDSYYNEKCYPEWKHFYEWVICLLKSLNARFISYKDAVIELENGN